MWILLAVVILTCLATIFFVHPTGGPPSIAPPDPKDVQAAAEWKKFEPQIRALRERGRWGEAVRKYGEFPRDLLFETSTGRKIQQEREELLRAIAERYREDWAELAKMLVGAPGEPRQNPAYAQALALLARIEEYATDDLLPKVLDEKRRIQATLDALTRDYLHRVRQGFIGRMKQRRYSEALDWVLSGLLTTQPPPPIERSWLLLPGLDYAELAREIREKRYEDAAARLAPHLVTLGSLAEVETPRLVLFDVVCGAYACLGEKLGSEGLRRAALFEEVWQLRSVAPEPGRLSLRGETPIMTLSSGETRPVEISSISPAELGALAGRAVAEGREEAREKALQDPSLCLARAALLLYSPEKGDLENAVFLLRRGAFDLKFRLCEVLLVLMDSGPR